MTNKFAIGDRVKNGHAGIEGIVTGVHGKYLSLSSGSGTGVDWVTEHKPSVFNNIASASMSEQVKFLRSHGYDCFFYSAEFAEENDDFSGAGDEWVIRTPDGRETTFLSAYRQIFGRFGWEQ